VVGLTDEYSGPEDEAYAWHEGLRTRRCDQEGRPG
jgi:hypothetical protein